MNDVWKKIIVISILAIILFGAGLFSGMAITETKYSKRIDGITDRNKLLEDLNRQEREARARAEQTAVRIGEAYTELDNNYRKRQRELEQAQTLNRKLVSGSGEAQNLTSEIGKGIDRLDKRLADIIRKVQSIKEP